MKFINKKWGNYYWVFLYRLLIALFLFQISRILFYLLNRPMFPGLTWSQWGNILKGGFRFDLSALLYVNLLFILMMLFPFPFRKKEGYQRIIKAIFFLANGIALFLNCIDFIYFRFTLKRTTRSVFGEFENETNIGRLFGRFLIDYWYVALLFAALLALMIWLYNRVKIQVATSKLKPWLFYIQATVMLALVAFLTVGGIRGDFRHSTRPITISNAGDYVTRSEDMYLVLNTPFCMVRTWNVTTLKELNYFSDTEVEQIYSPLHAGSPLSDSGMKKDNVVLIILESFGKESVGAYNRDLENGNYTGYTPFLDSLMGVSKVVWNSFANGRKSIDALPSLLAGIPSGLDPFVLTPYASDSIRGLPYLLDKEGYHTSFFHGAPNGSMGFSAMMNLLGVKHHYGMDEYNHDEDFDGMWGIWDEPFFQFFANTLETFKEPFFSTIFSVSSHHPYRVPPQYKDTFKKGPLPLMECIGYTDMALRKFFERVSQMDWYKHTLFVIAADHATVAYDPVYQNAWGAVAIPILLFHPGDSALRGVDSTGVIQQIDVMPTVLSYLNYPKPFLAFGENAFTQNRLNFSFYYNNGYYWIEHNYLLFFDGERSRALYDYKKDRLFKDNLIKTEHAIVNKLERHLKAFIQQYNNRLTRNQLTYIGP